MSPNLNARGLGLGETPLRRWGGYRGSFIVSVGHRHRRRNAKLSIAVHRLVLHRARCHRYSHYSLLTIHYSLLTTYYLLGGGGGARDDRGVSIEAW
eukprot:scaffold86076_cov109-Phaeocystis_antarctica.AAC.1